MKITETYRPSSLDNVVAQSTAVRQIRSIVTRNGYAGASFWLTGETGTGKTTIASILASEFCGTEFTVTEIVGRDVTVEFIRDYDRRMSYKPMGIGRCLIINESQDMSDSVVSLLLSLVEKINRSSHDMIIFTAMVDVLELRNDPMNRWRALQGRCSVIELSDTSSPVFRQDVVEYLEGIAAQEGIRGVDITGLCEKAKWSIRQALNLLDMQDRVPSEPRSSGSGYSVPCSPDMDAESFFASIPTMPIFARPCSEPGMHNFPLNSLEKQDIEYKQHVAETIAYMESNPEEFAIKSPVHAGSLNRSSSRTDRVYINQFCFIKTCDSHWTCREKDNLKEVLRRMSLSPSCRVFETGSMLWTIASDGRMGALEFRGKIQTFLIERSENDMRRHRQEWNDTLDTVLAQPLVTSTIPSDSFQQVPVQATVSLDTCSNGRLVRWDQATLPSVSEPEYSLQSETSRSGSGIVSITLGWLRKVPALF